jgi:hypothetical protein
MMNCTLMLKARQGETGMEVTIVHQIGINTGKMYNISRLGDEHR